MDDRRRAIPQTGTHWRRQMPLTAQPEYKAADPLPEGVSSIDLIVELQVGQELRGTVSYVHAKEGVYVDIGLAWRRKPDGFRQRALVPLSTIALYTSFRIGQMVTGRVASIDDATYEVLLDLIEPRFVQFALR